jgi:hypothetical protein
LGVAEVLLTNDVMPYLVAELKDAVSVRALHPVVASVQRPSGWPEICVTETSPDV